MNASHLARRARPLNRSVGLALAALVVLGPAVAGAASIQGPRRSALDRLEEGDAIRKRLLLRGGRFEAQPLLGFTLNDAFQRNVLFGVQLAYYFTDTFGLGLHGMGGFAVDSDLAERISEERPEKTDAGAFSNVNALATLDAIYTPLVGKFALFGRSVLNYDVHLLAGIGGALLAGSSKLDEFTPAGVLGVGLRTFVTDGMALNVEVRDHIYSAALAEVVGRDASGKPATDADSNFSNNFAVTVGFGFFFPMDPNISE